MENEVIACPTRDSLRMQHAEFAMVQQFGHPHPDEAVHSQKGEAQPWSDSRTFSWMHLIAGCVGRWKETDAALKRLLNTHARRSALDPEWSTLTRMMDATRYEVICIPGIVMIPRDIEHDVLRIVQAIPTEAKDKIASWQTEMQRGGDLRRIVLTVLHQMWQQASGAPAIAARDLLCSVCTEAIGKAQAATEIKFDETPFVMPGYKQRFRGYDVFSVERYVIDWVIPFDDYGVGEPLSSAIAFGTDPSPHYKIPDVFIDGQPVFYQTAHEILNGTRTSWGFKETPIRETYVKALRKKRGDQALCRTEEGRTILFTHRKYINWDRVQELKQAG